MRLLLTLFLCAALYGQSPAQKPAPIIPAAPKVEVVDEASLPLLTADEEKDLMRAALNYAIAQLQSMRALKDGKYGYEIQNTEQQAGNMFNSLRASHREKHSIPVACDWNFFRSAWECQKESK